MIKKNEFPVKPRRNTSTSSFLPAAAGTMGQTLVLWAWKKCLRLITGLIINCFRNPLIVTRPRRACTKAGCLGRVTSVWRFRLIPLSLAGMNSFLFIYHLSVLSILPFSRRSGHSKAPVAIHPGKDYVVLIPVNYDIILPSIYPSDPAHDTREPRPGNSQAIHNSRRP